MTFDEIMENITLGLTWDYEKDLPYLQEQIEKYKDHEMSKEIIRACGRLIYQILPEDKKDEISKIMQKEDLRFQETLDEVRFNIYKKDFSRALNIMEALVSKIENLEDTGMYQNDSVSEYYSFNDFFEELLFKYLHKSQRDVRHSDIPFGEIYLQYGSLLIDLKRFSDAQVALEKAVRWCPTNAKIAFEYIETFKMLGDIETFFSRSIDNFKIAYSPADVAHCYRNIAYYFVEKELWSEAIACNLMSLQFEKESKNAMAELYFIQQKTNGTVPQPDMDQLRAYGDKYGFPIGADKVILELAFAYGKLSVNQKQFDAAKYFFDIVYALTNDDQIKAIIDKLPLKK